MACIWTKSANMWSILKLPCAWRCTYANSTHIYWALQETELWSRLPVAKNRVLIVSANDTCTLEIRIIDHTPYMYAEHACKQSIFEMPMSYSHLMSFPFCSHCPSQLYANIVRCTCDVHDGYFDIYTCFF